MSRAQLWTLAALFSLAGFGLAGYKAAVLGFPLESDAERQIWTIQARFSIDAAAGPVKAVLQIPSGEPGFSILDENFVSRGYGVTSRRDGPHREAEWTIRRASGRQTLYYRAQIDAGRRDGPRPARVPMPRAPRLEEPFRTALAGLVEAARERSADAASFTSELLRLLNDPSPDERVRLLLTEGRSRADRARLAVHALAAYGIPSRVAYVLELEDRQRHARFRPWLEVLADGDWLHFDPDGGLRGLPAGHLVWWRGDRPLIQVTGAANPEVEVSVQRSAISALEIAERRAEVMGSRTYELSLLGLPIQTQAVYAVLLQVPVGALVMVVMRNVVGIKTFGIFMPVLIALAFRETRLLYGVLLFSVLIALGLSVRFYLDRLRLLLVPRLAAVLTAVILMMTLVSVLSDQLGFEYGLSVALFPMVILVMAIERLSVLWEERGAVEATLEGLGSLAVAAIAYGVMSLDWVEHMVFVFPELLLVVLAAILLIGRYRGYRLVELTRFRALADLPAGDDR